MMAISMEGGGWPPLLDGERVPAGKVAASRRTPNGRGSMPKRLPLRRFQNRQSLPVPIHSCLSFIILHLSFSISLPRWSNRVKAGQTKMAGLTQWRSFLPRMARMARMTADRSQPLPIREIREIRGQSSQVPVHEQLIRKMELFQSNPVKANQG
jgi:hypothetical protein